MRFLLFVAMLVVGATAMAPRAQAQNYPWCAVYSGGFSGTNCGFSTFQQCLATISGIGGSCMPNTQYRPPTGASRSRSRRNRDY